mmetsp:Transcript_118958/g.337265  ORF Transcript_118958/g.337265 Transcript_118958/m.337265 type:complete len:315 (-) Transcript_118958:65-1009(-)
MHGVGQGRPRRERTRDLRSPGPPRSTFAAGEGRKSAAEGPGHNCAHGGQERIGERPEEWGRHRPAAACHLHGKAHHPPEGGDRGRGGGVQRKAAGEEIAGKQSVRPVGRVPDVGGGGRRLQGRHHRADRQVSAVRPEAPAALHGVHSPGDRAPRRAPPLPAEVWRRAADRLGQHEGPGQGPRSENRQGARRRVAAGEGHQGQRQAGHPGRHEGPGCERALGAGNKGHLQPGDRGRAAATEGARPGPRGADRRGDLRAGLARAVWDRLPRARGRGGGHRGRDRAPRERGGVQRQGGDPVCRPAADRPRSDSPQDF